MRKLYFNWQWSPISMFALICLLHTSSRASGQNAILNVPQGNQFVLDQDNVTIDCQPVASAYDNIYAITIKRSTSTTTDNKVVTSSLDGGVTLLIWQDTSVENRVNTNQTIYDITTPSSTQLKYAIPAANTQCSDAATYTCEITGIKSGTIVGNNVVTKYVSVTVSSDKMKSMIMSPQPQSNGEYNVTTNITFSCTGTIGAYNSSLEIKWCIKRSKDGVFMEASNMGRIEQNIEVTVDSCQIRTSTFVYTVVEQDTNTQILCQLMAANTSDSSDCGYGKIRSSLNITNGSTRKTTTASTKTPSSTEKDISGANLLTVRADTFTIVTLAVLSTIRI